MKSLQQLVILLMGKIICMLINMMIGVSLMRMILKRLEWKMVAFHIMCSPIYHMSAV